MSRLPVHFFINPTAGRGRAAKRLKTIREIARSKGVSLDVHESREPGDMEAQVQSVAIRGASVVIVAGGDGSIHEAVNGILRSGTDTPLGVIPTGTGNDFAKAAGVTLDWEAATALLADRLLEASPPRPIDVGVMNGRYFANGAGIGFDAKVTALARQYRWPIGDLVYLFAIFKAFRDPIATPSVRIRAGDYSWDGPLTLASVSNGPWIGGMFHIAPMARNDDGQLELLIAAPVTRRRIVTLLPKLMNGTHVHLPEISHQPATALEIDCESDLLSHLDGEVQAPVSRFEIELRPGALRLA
ncbi:MAG: diacylglycerol kinase family lipid kinase [Woeseiaceae bacterium]|nr:diacylglycerol kinase family lipid kinase [Woeseiaceae bacterium]